MIAAAAAYVALIAVGVQVSSWHVQLCDLLLPVLLVMTLRAVAWHWRPLDLFLLLLIAGSAFSIPGSIAPRQSELAVLKDVYLFTAYLTLAHVMTRTGVLPIMRWLPVSVAVIAALSLAAALIFGVSGSVWSLFGQPMPLPYLGEVFRLTGTLETPEFFGNLLTCAIPLAVICRARTADRRAWTAAVVAMAVAAALTFSKSLGGCVAALTLLWWPQWRGRRGVALKVLSVSASMLVIVAFNVTAAFSVRTVGVAFGKDATIPPPPYLYAQQDAAGADTMLVRIAYNPMSYYLLKRAEWVAWRRQPILGIGAGTFALEAERAYQEGRLPQAYRRVVPHSTFFGRLAETGLVGMVTLVAAFAGVWLCARAALSAAGTDRQVAWACVAGLVGLLINGINVDIMHFRFVWLGLAAIRAVDQRSAEGS